MSFVTDTWRQLVRRRLWPLALLLVGALAAVPFLLAKEPEPVVTPPLPGGAAVKAPAEADGEPIVALASADEARRRRVLGTRKDPFEPAPRPAPKATATPAAEGVGVGAAPVDPVVTGGAPAGSGSGGGVPPVSTPPVAPPAGTEPGDEKKSWPLYTATVRFGSTEGQLTKKKVKRLGALPDPDEPVLVYLGVEEGGKVAVFMIDSNVDAQGDGTCKPDPQTCETLHMRIGDTMFFDVLSEDGESVTAQYQLDLVDIKRRTAGSAAAARKAYAVESKAGRAVLRLRQESEGPLRWTYDRKRGTVRKLDKQQFQAAVARVTRAAKASAGAFDVER
jgi:hypothetical protein